MQNQFKADVFVLHCKTL